MRRHIVALSVLALSACAPATPPAAEPATIEVPPPGAPAPSRAVASAPAPGEQRKKHADASAADDDGRDARRPVMAPRSRKLVATEATQLEQLFGQVATTAPDRPNIARRLAEDWVEMETSALLDGADAEAAAARANAVKYYNIIRTDHPSYAQTDEVLYYLAYEYEQGHDLANARKTYYELIMKRPASKYIPNAYLAFGEMFFQEGAGDPSKWDLAVQAYNEVLKYPPPQNRVFGYAEYKLGWVFFNKGEPDKALSAFKRTIDFGTTYPQLPGAEKLAAVARKDIIPAYALKGNPSVAYNFFHLLSGDSPGTSDRTIKMMLDLAANYNNGGHYAEESVIYQDLSVRDAAGSCRWRAYADLAAKAARSGSPPSDTDIRVALAQCP